MDWLFKNRFFELKHFWSRSCPLFFLSLLLLCCWIVECLSECTVTVFLFQWNLCEVFRGRRSLFLDQQCVSSWWFLFFFISLFAFLRLFFGETFLDFCVDAFQKKVFPNLLIYLLFILFWRRLWFVSTSFFLANPLGSPTSQNEKNEKKMNWKP